MACETKDSTSRTGRPGVMHSASAWVFVAWMVVVCSSYAYFMLRSFF